MVFSDDFLHFLYIDQEIFFQIHQNYLVALIEEINFLFYLTFLNMTLSLLISMLFF